MGVIGCGKGDLGLPGSPSMKRRNKMFLTEKEKAEFAAYLRRIQEDISLAFKKPYHIPTEKCYSQYLHHGRKVWVREELKGHHREICMCMECSKFHPESRENNCLVANALYVLDMKFDLVTPVWECPDFDLKDPQIKEG